MHSLQGHSTGSSLFIFALKFGECPNISDIFEAKNDIDLVQYLTDLTLLHSKKLFL